MTDPRPDRSCPACTSVLAPHVHEGVDLDRCPAGCGLWLDRAELGAVVQSELAARPEHEERAAMEAARGDAGAAVVAEAARERRACPVCGRAMRLEEYSSSGVPIDACGDHGVWLDDGELERIEAFAEGMRRQVADGPAGDAARSEGASTVRGLTLPPELLRTIRSAALPSTRG